MSAPVSSAGRATEAPEAFAIASEPSDTLLSAGAPANRLELLLEDRLGAVDQRLRELDQRVRALELRKPSKLEEARTKPWLWVVFLVAVAVAFQLLRLAE